MGDRVPCVVAACLCALVGPARAADVPVNCGEGDSIQAALDSLDPVGPNTITVTGTCGQSVTIRQFDRLTIQAPEGQVATIVAPSGNAIDIGGSRNVTLRRLAITGGVNGVYAHDGSLVLVEDSVVGPTDGDGIVVQALSAVSLVASTVEDNRGLGVRVRQGCQATLEGHEGHPTLIRGNLDGVYCTESSACVFDLVTIEDNYGTGLMVTRTSSARLETDRGRNAIRGNWQDGIVVNFNSFAALVRTDVERNAGSGFNVQQNSSLVIRDSAVRDNVWNAFSIFLMSHVFLADGNEVAGNQAPAFSCDVTSELLMSPGYAFMPQDLDCKTVWRGGEVPAPGDPRPGRVH